MRDFKERWQNWSYPKRGAFIGFLSLFIWALLAIFLVNILGYVFVIFPSTILFSLLSFIWWLFPPGSSLISIMLGYSASLMVSLFQLVIAIASYTLAGAFLGWVYGKLQGRKIIFVIIVILFIVLAKVLDYYLFL